MVVRMAWMIEDGAKDISSSSNRYPLMNASEKAPSLNTKWDFPSIVWIVISPNKFSIEEEGLKLYRIKGRPLWILTISVLNVFPEAVIPSIRSG